MSASASWMCRSIAESARVLPQFFLFLDEHYYRENRSARIITFLETLYKFPEVEVNDPALQAQLDRQMADLAKAVNDSPELNRAISATISR